MPLKMGLAPIITVPVYHLDVVINKSEGVSGNNCFIAPTVSMQVLWGWRGIQARGMDLTSFKIF